MSKEDILPGYPLTKAGLAALDFAARQFQDEEVRVFSGGKLRHLFNIRKNLCYKINRK